MMPDFFQSKRENVEAVESTYDSDSDPNMRGDFDDDSTKTESCESLSDREGDIWFIRVVVVSRLSVC
jgi:hypothetical protein